MKLHFTMDLEEWFDAENIRPYVEEYQKDHSSMYVVDRILDFLDQRNVRGTFFCLGSTAEANKPLIRTIARAGHEIASHGWSHRLLPELDEQQTLSELVDSRKQLEDLSETPVIGYRSPCFSRNAFIISCLQDAGFQYTSMRIQASYHDRYGTAPGPEISIKDFPLPVAEIFNVATPATGGGWFRLFPIALQKWLTSKSIQSPLVFYCHPWDFDDRQPRVSSPLFARLRHTVNVKRSFDKLGKLSFDPRPLRELLD